MADEIKKNSFLDIFRFIPSSILIFGGVIIGVVIYAVEIAKVFTWQKAGFYLVIVILAIFFFGAKKKTEGQLPGEEECRLILKQAIQRRQDVQDFPKGIIEFSGEVGSDDLEKDLLNYEYGFKVLDENSGVGQIWSVKVNPKTRDCFNWIRRREGFSAKNTLKLKLHPKYYELYGVEVKK